MAKQWAEISEFPGYWISSEGDVFSEKSRKVLKPKSDGNGYIQYAFRRGGRTFYRKRYSLVAWYFTHFVPEKGVKYDIHHVDESTTNDRHGNLMITNHRHNICVALAYPIRVTCLKSGENYIYPEGFNHWCRSVGWSPKNAASKFSRDGRYKGYTFERTGDRYV